MRSQVAGLSINKGSVSPASLRAAFTASWMAKNTDAARNNGGSPTACNTNKLSIEDTTRKALLSHTLDEKIALGLGALPNSATRKSIGMSWQEGILYVPGPVVKS